MMMIIHTFLYRHKVVTSEAVTEVYTPLSDLLFTERPLVFIFNLLFVLLILRGVFCQHAVCPPTEEIVFTS